MAIHVSIVLDDSGKRHEIDMTPTGVTARQILQKLGISPQEVNIVIGDTCIDQGEYVGHGAVIKLIKKRR